MPFDFSNFTLDNVDKIEIVRGAESAIYGTDAVAGVIQVFTHRGDTRAPAFSILRRRRHLLLRTRRRATQRSSRQIRLFRRRSYFHTDGQGPNQSFLNRTLSGNFGYTLSDKNQLRLSVRNNTSDAGIPGQTLITPPSLHTINDLEHLSRQRPLGFHHRHALAQRNF